MAMIDVQQGGDRINKKTHSKVDVCGYTGASTRVPLAVPPTESESMISVAEPAAERATFGLVGLVTVVVVAI